MVVPVQALRGLAALSVAMFHVLFVAGAAVGEAGRPDAWANRVPLQAGVDIFFVISGFVIILASARLFGRWSSVPSFLARRLVRVVPLYWLATTALLGALLSGVRLHATTLDGSAHVIASYLFIPWPRADGDVVPVLSLGWTLNLEMTFYAIVASFLWLPRGFATCAILATLVALAGCHFVGHGMSPQIWFITRPVILEFALGVLIATLRLAAVRMSAALRVALALAALAALAFGDVSDRVVSYGLPAGVLVAAAGLGDDRLSPGVTAICVWAGDISYALYITHPFAIAAVGELWRHLGLPRDTAVASYLAAAVIAAVGGAAVIHVAFEKPVMRLARRHAVGRDI